MTDEIPGTPSLPRKPGGGGGRHVAETNGLTREAMGAASLLGSSVPKGLLAATFGANHASDADTLTRNQTFAQRDVAGVVGEIEAVARSRHLRATARDAEGIPATSSSLSVDSPRLLAHGRGPRVVVKAMQQGDVARAIAMFARYGYTINRPIHPTRLDAMTHFTYWKTGGAVITGAVPQQKRQTIADAFDRGVTVWTTISEIGSNQTGVNTPHSGIAY